MFSGAAPFSVKIPVRYAHILFAPVPDGEVGSVLDFGVLATGKVRFTKDIAQEHYALHFLLGVVEIHGRSAAGQSPCGGQHQCPGTELEKCSAVDHSNAPPVSGITQKTLFCGIRRSALRRFRSHNPAYSFPLCARSKSQK